MQTLQQSLQNIKLDGDEREELKNIESIEDPETRHKEIRNFIQKLQDRGEKNNYEAKKTLDKV